MWWEQYNYKNKNDILTIFFPYNFWQPRVSSYVAWQVDFWFFFTRYIWGETSLFVHLVWNFYRFCVALLSSFFARSSHVLLSIEGGTLLYNNNSWFHLRWRLIYLGHVDCFEGSEEIFFKICSLGFDAFIIYITFGYERIWYLSLEFWGCHFPTTLVLVHCVGQYYWYVTGEWRVSCMLGFGGLWMST